jgi:hypothetical protein
MTPTDRNIKSVFLLLLCALIIVVSSAIIYYNYIDYMRVDPLEIKTITVIDKYEGQFLIFDQDGAVYRASNIDIYVRLHPQRSYSVIIGTIEGSRLPIVNQKYKYIKEVLEEVIV